MVTCTILLYISVCSCGVSCLQELVALSKVKRFSVAIMFLSRKDKQSKFEYDKTRKLLQWSPSIMDTTGTKDYVLYSEVSFAWG